MEKFLYSHCWWIHIAPTMLLSVWFWDQSTLGQIMLACVALTPNSCFCLIVLTLGGLQWTPKNFIRERRLIKQSRVLFSFVLFHFSFKETLEKSMPGFRLTFSCSFQGYQILERQKIWDLNSICSSATGTSPARIKN